MEGASLSSIVEKVFSGEIASEEILVCERPKKRLPCKSSFKQGLSSGRSMNSV